MLQKLCHDIRSFDEVNTSGRPTATHKRKITKSLPRVLRLAIDARVMITRNISVIDGIANGVTGKIVRFAGTGQEVSNIVIKCDSLRTGQLHRSTCKHCRGNDTICVVRENLNDEAQCNDARANVKKQFPLRLSWAMTVHKAQGLTVDELVLSTKDLFGPGMGYTGLSRQRREQRLFLKDLHPQKIYCDPAVDNALSRMKRLPPTMTFADDQGALNVVFHNIEGLECNVTALRNHYLSKQAHLILLAETWMTNDGDTDSIQLSGYRFVHRTRSASFSSDHPLKLLRHGGVAVYIRHDLSMSITYPPVPLDFEHLLIESKQKRIVFIVCYRSPQQKKTDFVTNLMSLLISIDPDKRIVILGDMNENTFDADSRVIDQSLSQLGFINVMNNVPTTDRQTSLDCVYINFLSTETDYAGVAGSFYSLSSADLHVFSLA